MLQWLTVFLGLAYIALGIFVIVKKAFGIPLETPLAYGLGAVLIVYGLFRIARFYANKRKQNEDV